MLRPPLVQKRHHGAQGFAAVADGIFLLLRDLGAGLAVFGQIEEGVIAEAILPADLTADHALHGAANHVLGSVRENGADRRDESGGALLVGHILHALHDLTHLVVVIRVVSQVAGGIDTGLAAQRIDHKP